MGSWGNMSCMILKGQILVSITLSKHAFRGISYFGSHCEKEELEITESTGFRRTLLLPQALQQN